MDRCLEFSQQTDFLKELLIIHTGSSPIPTFILEWVNIGARFMVTEMVMWSLFDSYGRSPNSNSVYFVRWLDTYAKSIEINDKQLQSDNSTLCGVYCILFLRQRFHGQTMQDIVSVFDSTNACANDEYVYDFISNAYSCCVQTDDLFLEMYMKSVCVCVHFHFPYIVSFSM